MDKKQKKVAIIKSIAIFLAVFIVVPLAIITIVYYSNESFSNYMNKSLNNVPGFIGEYFSKYPTEQEKEDKKLFLANYYLELDNEISADKMYIVKQNDEVLFNEIVRIMDSISSTKTEEILKLVRSIELRKDLLFSLYDEVQKERDGEFNSEANEIEKMPLDISLIQIEDLIQDNQTSRNIKSDILSKLSSERLSDALYYMDPDMKKEVLTLLDPEKEKEVTLLLREKELSYKELVLISKTYEVKNAQKAFEEIGNTGLYSINELSVIYMNISVKKAGEILLYSENEKFIEDLFADIRKEEKLQKKEISTTVQIRKYINFLYEYNEKIEELVSIYSKMKPEESAPIIDQMISNDKNITLFNIDGTEEFKISDSSIIIEVLSRMKETTLSQILNYVEPDKAVEITRRLATH